MVAVLVLLLQSSVAAWAAAAMPASPAVDMFGNPLCIGGADHGSPAGDDHSRLPDCCAIACASAVSVLHMPDAALGFFHPLRSVETPRPAMPGQQDRRTRDHDPGRPRAPPLAA